MDISYVCEFVTLAETCNYMEAADQLFISQSALSRHIKTLEEDLGIQLFDRSTRKVSLTKLGTLFLPYARQIAATRYEYEAAIAAAQNAEHGNIRIGTIPVMSQYHITDLLVSFQKNNTGFSMDLVEGDSTDLVRMLRSGQCDLAFIREGEENTGEFNVIRYDTDQLAAFVPKTHPFAKQSFIRIEQLRNEPLILLSKNTFMHSLCVTSCQNAGFHPNVVLTTHRASNMLDLVRKGMGIALLSRRPTIPLMTDDIIAIDIEPRIITNIDLVYPKNHQLSTGAKRFINLVNISKK